MILKGWTIQEAQELRSKTIDAIMSITDGTAKSYKVGTREYVALSLDDLKKLLKDADDTISYLMNPKKYKNVRRVIPRDL